MLVLCPTRHAQEAGRAAFRILVHPGLTAVATFFVGFFGHHAWLARFATVLALKILGLTGKAHGARRKIDQWLTEPLGTRLARKFAASFKHVFAHVATQTRKRSGAGFQGVVTRLAWQAEGLLVRAKRVTMFSWIAIFARITLVRQRGFFAELAFVTLDTNA